MAECVCPTCGFEHTAKEEAKVIEDTLCPECNAKMVSRKGQYGTFWGCSKYPNCRGTRDSQGRSKAEREAERAKEPVQQEEGFRFQKR